MPKSSAKKLAYQLEYNNKHVKEQSARRQAQRVAVRDGSSPIGDGKDIAHKVAAANGGSIKKSNLKLQDPSENRGWRKGQKGYKVPNVK